MVYKMHFLLLKIEKSRAGPELGSDVGEIMIVVRAFYGLRSSVAAFRALLVEVLDGL